MPKKADKHHRSGLIRKKDAVSFLILQGEDFALNQKVTVTEPPVNPDSEWVGKVVGQWPLAAPTHIVAEMKATKVPPPSKEKLVKGGVGPASCRVTIGDANPVSTVIDIDLYGG